MVRIFPHHSQNLEETGRSTTDVLVAVLFRSVAFGSVKLSPVLFGSVISRPVVVSGSVALRAGTVGSATSRSAMLESVLGTAGTAKAAVVVTESAIAMMMLSFMVTTSEDRECGILREAGGRLQSSRVAEKLELFRAKQVVES